MSSNQLNPYNRNPYFKIALDMEEMEKHMVIDIIIVEVHRIQSRGNQSYYNNNNNQHRNHNRNQQQISRGRGNQRARSGGRG